MLDGIDKDGIFCSLTIAFILIESINGEKKPDSINYLILRKFGADLIWRMEENIKFGAD